MAILSINDRIRCREASRDPLSADIGIIRAGDAVWLYDVGCGEDNLSGVPESECVVLSHFHADHTGNIGRIRTERVYVSKETYGHVRRGTVVDSDLYVGDMHIFPLPSCHAKGCLGLEVGGTHAFVGDALYSKVRDGCYVYNAQLLQEEIRVLAALQSPCLLVSHYPGLVRKKDDVLRELEKIYGRREKNTAEIRIPIQTD